jgi:hypothetical protein
MTRVNRLTLFSLQKPPKYYGTIRPEKLFKQIKLTIKKKFENKNKIFGI